MLLVDIKEIVKEGKKEKEESKRKVEIEKEEEKIKESWRRGEGRNYGGSKRRRGEETDKDLEKAFKEESLYCLFVLNICDRWQKISI